MNAKKEGRTFRRPSLIVIVLAFVIIMMVSLGIGSITEPKNTDIGDCKAPGYTFVSGVMAKDLSGNQVYIGRAVVSMGETMPGGMQYYIPPCASRDAALTNVSGMFVTIDDKLAFIANGAVGLTTPLALTPQP